MSLRWALLFRGMEELADGDWIYPASTHESDQSPFQAPYAPHSVLSFSAVSLWRFAAHIFMHVYSFFLAQDR